MPERLGQPRMQFHLRHWGSLPHALHLAYAVDIQEGMVRMGGTRLCFRVLAQNVRIASMD